MYVLLEAYMIVNIVRMEPEYKVHLSLSIKNNPTITIN